MISRLGDVFGPTVNVAVPPDVGRAARTVLVDEGVHEALEPGEGESAYALKRVHGCR